MSYIECEKAIKEIRDTYEYEYPTASGAFDEFVTMLIPRILNNIPPADVAEVKHGEWKQSPHCKRIYYCSECGRHIENGTQNPQEFFPYCHCGAKMDLKGVTHDVAR